MESSPPIEIDILRQFLDSIDSFNQDLVQDLRPDEKLCHYTTLAGALSIIDGGDLWLTNSRYSNDDEELDHGYAVVKDVLDQMKNDARWTESNLEDLHNRLTAARGDQVYICCFCEKDDLLSQWRGYAENGGGVSIEFDPAKFTHIAGPDSPNGLMRLWKVFYSREKQERIVRRCLEYNWGPGEDERIRRVVDALQFFMPTFKKDAFREEQERRLIFTPYSATTPRPSFRTRGTLLLPYYGLQALTKVPGVESGEGNAFRLPITNVLIGPAMHRNLNVESMKMMLQSREYREVSVKASEIPYRG